MEYSKVKNIIIFILLAVNMFFLALFLIGRSESGKIEKKAKEDIVSIFASNGISLDISLIPPDSEIGYYKLTRELDSEKLIAETILGTKDMTMSATEGNVNQYANSIFGEASFRPNGDFSISVTSGKEFSDNSTKALITLLKNLKIEVNENVNISDSNNLTTFTFNCEYNKTRIFNGRVTMNFDGKALVSMAGKRPISLPRYSESTIMSVKTALIYFNNGIKSIDVSCNKITGIKAGYIISDSASGSTDLLPVWLIETNSGSYYVNGINPKISAVLD